ncbi:MAG: hypothetical protein Q8N18_09245 [Opitutaceae bacterium]|nr:hypothetical protein [Opitutaceae bacterium]
MSAKPAKRKAPSPAPAQTVPATVTTSAALPETAAPSWLDSADPRKRTWGQIALVVLWLYVAALWLLALDQSFGWGIFGPKVPSIP